MWWVSGQCRIPFRFVGQGFRCSDPGSWDLGCLLAYLDDPTETHRLQLHLRVPGLASQRVGQTLSLQVLRAASRPIRTPRRNFAPISSSIRKHYRASARTRGMARSDSPRQEGGVSTTLPAHLAALSASTFLPEFRMLPGHKSGVIRAWNTP